MDQDLSAFVWQRANATCEYCQLPQRFSSIPFEIDHIIAHKHRSATEAANLALSCFYCNSYKGPNIAGIDPVSRRLVRLYHPRKGCVDNPFPLGRRHPYRPNRRGSSDDRRPRNQPP